MLSAWWPESHALKKSFDNFALCALNNWNNIEIYIEIYILNRKSCFLQYCFAQYLYYLSMEGKAWFIILIFNLHYSRYQSHYFVIYINIKEWNSGNWYYVTGDVMTLPYKGALCVFVTHNSMLWFHAPLPQNMQHPHPSFE